MVTMGVVASSFDVTPDMVQPLLATTVAVVWIPLLGDIFWQILNGFFNKQASAGLRMAIPQGACIYHSFPTAVTAAQPFCPFLLV